MSKAVNLKVTEYALSYPDLFLYQQGMTNGVLAFVTNKNPTLF